VRSSVTFDWVEQGAALVMRMGGAATPAATWIFGRDEAEPDYHVLYTDDRGVSRVYRMSLSDRTWRIWRDTPDFSQLFTAEITAGQDEILGSWQKSVGRRHDLGARLRGSLQPLCAVTGAEDPSWLKFVSIE
jgi:hypothetical protein